MCFQWSREEVTEASMYEQGENGKIEMSLMHFHVSSQHYDNMPMQYTAISYDGKTIIIL